jgi:ribonuclease HI
MLGFNNEAQGWLPCKIVETAPQEKLWTVEWWDHSQEDRTKGEEELRPFEEAGWWYRIVQKARAKKCLHCHNTDGTYGKWRTEVEWLPRDWAKTRGNARCKECLDARSFGHDEEEEGPHGGGQRSKDRGRKLLHQTVMVCQPTDTRLRGNDRDMLGTVTLTVKDLRRILTHGQHFPFFTAKEREEGGVGHWETRAWETCDIEVWGTTADLGFPVTKHKDIVQSARDAAEGRRTNLMISPEILRFSRQVLEQEAQEKNPNECIRILRELVIQWHQDGDTMDSTFSEEDMTTGDQNLATQMGWCPMHNAWVASWTGFTDNERHKDNRGWESTSIPLQWADPLPLLAVPGTPQVGKNFFLDETCPVRGFVSVAPTSLAWRDKVGRYEVKLTQGLAVSLHAQYSWTIPSGAWTHRRALFRGEPEELVRAFHSERLRQEALEKAGHCSPKWTVLRSLQKVYGARKIRGCTILDAPPFFESAGREEPADLTNKNTTGEGSVPNQEERGSPIFWGDNQGPVVMVWDGMLPGEQERAKTIIAGDDDWIIWRVKPSRSALGEQGAMDRQSQVTTDFLEQHGIRLEGVKPKGRKAQRTSEKVSRGGFTRRKGWYRTNDIRTTACSRDMEVWVPKSGKSLSQESIEEVWEAWRNDAPKDECKVQLGGPEEEWWAGTEMGLLRAYWFDGHVTASDGSVGTGSMGAGFVWLDRSKDGSERVGREEEGTSSGRAEMGAYAAILRRTPDNEDLVTATDSEVLCRVVDRWVGQGGKASLANTADADILEYILTKLAARIAAGSRTFLIKVKAHRGEPLNEGADDLAEAGREIKKEGENSRWRERTTRVVYTYYDRNLGQWKKGTWTKTVRNAARRGAAESLMEERLQTGANKWRKGLFKERSEDTDSDQQMPDQNWRSDSPDKWDMIASGKWMQKAAWNRWVTTLERDQPHKTPITSTWTADFLTREGEGRKSVGDWLRDKTISWKARRRLLQTNAGVFPCVARLQRWGKHPDGICELCKRCRALGLKLLGGKPARGTTGHLQSSVCRLQAPAATGAHNTCFQRVQDDMSKARSVCRDWKFVSKGTEISLGKFVSTYFTPLTLDSRSDVVSTEDTEEIWKAAKEEAMEKAKGNANRQVRVDSPMVDEAEVEKSFWLSRPDGWVINEKTKKIILLEFKRTSDYGESYFKDMWRVAEKQHTPIMIGLRALAEEREWEVAVVPLVAGQRSVREKEWLEAFKTFGIGKEDGQRIITRLGRTLLDEHEKLFGSYWRHTFGPSSSMMQLLGKGISIRTSRPPHGGWSGGA